MRVGSIILLITVALLASTTPHALSADFIPQSLSATVYADGTVNITYGIEVDPTLTRVSAPLLGLTFTDLLVVNELSTPLVTSTSGSVITVDSLGASKLTFTYSTPELTSKVGILWTLNVTSPTNLVVNMPSGAIIISMNQIPLQIKTLDERSQITLPPGSNQISYVVSTVSAKDHAQAVIQEAETTINTVKTKGVKMTEADSLLAQAKTAITSGEYLSSEQYAAQAKASALNVEAQSLTADSAIQRATTAIQAARSESRTSSMADAEGLLTQAKNQYQAGNYVEAKATADRSYDSAVASKPQTNYTLLIAGSIVVLVVAVAGVFIYRRRRAEEAAKKAQQPKTTPKKTDGGVVNLEAIFRKHQELRLDDKEVLRYLVEHKGELFASEIRDRFNIPSTSAWRMIRRLIALGIVEERKVGGQSLIYIVKKYREEKE